jgi:hypothetical protein
MVKLSHSPTVLIKIIHNIQPKPDLWHWLTISYFIVHNLSSGVTVINALWFYITLFDLLIDTEHI